MRRWQVVDLLFHGIHLVCNQCMFFLDELWSMGGTNIIVH